jgi:hypothetical protein
VERSRRKVNFVGLTTEKETQKTVGFVNGFEFQVVTGEKN